MQTTQPIAGRSAVAADRETPQQQSKQQRKHNSRSTATADQLQRVLAALRAGPVTTDELRQVGIYQAPARVKTLRDRGYEIMTIRVDLPDAFGYPHRGLAKYVLLAEP
ncbi:MAG: helix-turn-helix domain-containing protein, partial [Burkholderiaceae bacterium]